MAAISAALFAASGATCAHAGDTASITVTATVVARTCTVTNKSQTVALGTVDAASLSSHGDVGASQEFTVSLTNCSNVNTVKVTATGTADDKDSTDFKNMASDSAATGAAVYIKGGTDEGTTLHPNGDGEGSYPVTDGAVDMKFKAILEATGATVSAGAVSVPITLNLAYE